MSKNNHAIYDAVERARNQTLGAIEFDFALDAVVLYGFKQGNDGDYDVMEQCDVSVRKVNAALDRILKAINPPASCLPYSR